VEDPDVYIGDIEHVFPYTIAMEHSRERAALVALLMRPQAKWQLVADEVEAAGSALKVILGDAEGQQALFRSTADVNEELSVATNSILTWEREGLSVVSLLDDDYPAQLLTVHQRPPLLMYRGTLDVHDASGVAIVGTRHPSSEGVRQARELGEGLADRGVPVISGLAAGIDTAALEGSLAGGGRTVAVIGTGLHRSYPRENAALQERIGRVGAVISQFLPDAPPTKFSFPMRNAVMSGYAAATVVVEAAWKSGARMQARLALEHGRPVFLLQSLLEHDWALEYAKRPGVTVVSGVDDVFSRLEQLAPRRDQLVWN
jgi:DNA processing protein